jgi:hypothetical protein
MKPTKISIATIGEMPFNFNTSKVKAWKSSIFEITGTIDNYALTVDADGEDWQFTDNNLSRVLPETGDSDFLFAIVNIPLELNWYTRRLSGDRVVFTFHEMKDILSLQNIPLENLVMRVLYAYAFAYRSHESRIPLSEERTNFTHDETRGCLFDMNGIKTDVAHSCDSPVICSDCVERLKQKKVSNSSISKAQSEIKKIRKPLFFRVTSFVKLHPILSLVASSLIAILLGAIGSIVGNYIFYALKNVV